MDTKSVMSGLEGLTEYDWRMYQSDSEVRNIAKDALVLLKEQEEQIKNRDESLEKAREEIKWLRGMLKEQEDTINELQNAYGYLQKQFFEAQDKLLKEQEAVEPIEVFRKDINCHEYHCKRCGNKVGTILGDKHPILPGVKLSIEHFCDVCGQAVKWDA